jgi:hypothetical protein
VEQIVQVHLPVQFGVQRKRQVNPSQLPRKTSVYQLFVRGVGGLLAFGKRGVGLFPSLALERFGGTPLFVVRALQGHIIGGGKVKIITHY